MDTAAVEPDPPVPGDPGDGREPEGRLTRWFGPLTALRVVALVVAVAFLAGAVGWGISERGRDPLNASDVGFMQDMGLHHDQAVQMSLLLLGKDDVTPNLKSYASEILVGQRFEQGVFNALLDRFGHDTDPGSTVMGWMGEGMPAADMPGLATEAQMDELRESSGTKAEALWIALMSQHHLGGLHMADWEARHGEDPTVRNLARAMVRSQRSEIIDLSRYRTTNDLPIPGGFTDPMDDQRLNPLSLADD